MKQQRIEVGRTYNMGGNIVEVIEILPQGKVVVECSSFGQDVVSARKLKEFDHRPFLSDL